MLATRYFSTSIDDGADRMKLYDSKLAPNARRVRVFLAEKNISVPLEPIDLMKLEQKSEDFTRLNPDQRVPVLVLDDGSVLAESVAICRYFEEIQPESPLFGTGALGRAQVEMWQRRVEFDLFYPVAEAIRNGHPAFAVLESPQLADWAEKSKARVMRELKRLDAALADRPFLAGELFSIADITALCAVDFMRLARIRIPEDHLHLARWHASVSARPSAAA